MFLGNWVIMNQLNGYSRYSKQLFEANDRQRPRIVIESYGKIQWIVTTLKCQLFNLVICRSKNVYFQNGFFDVQVDHLRSFSLGQDQTISSIAPQ